LGEDLALLRMKLGELPGMKTELYPPRLAIARMGLSVVSDTSSSSSWAAIIGFSARWGLLILRNCKVVERGADGEGALMWKGS